MKKIKIIYCLFLVVFSLQLGAMEKQLNHFGLYQIELPEELYAEEILPKIKNDLIYCTHNILNNKENILVPYNRIKGCSLAWYPYLGNQFIPVKNSVDHIVLSDTAEQYIVVENIYNSIANVWDLMLIAQSISCVNKQSYTFFQKDIQKVKEIIGHVIIYKTDYYSIIINMIKEKKANYFFTKQSVHYFIAYTLGYYCAFKNTLPDVPVLFSIQRLLWASCRTYANATDCQERTTFMPIDQPANESMNKFILYMFKGMLSLFHRDKKVEVTIKANKYFGSNNLSNTDYINSTAKKMNLDITMFFDSFLPKSNDDLHIQIKYASNEKDCVIQ